MHQMSFQTGSCHQLSQTHTSQDEIDYLKQQKILYRDQDKWENKHYHHSDHSTHKPNHLDPMSDDSCGSDSFLYQKIQSEPSLLYLQHHHQSYPSYTIYQEHMSQIHHPSKP